MSKQTNSVSPQPDVLSQVSGFIGRYLQCSDHQRTVLALWVLHAYCFYTAQVTPYLSIQSPHKQSGKTLCLQLLNLLCEDPALTSGFISNLTLRMKLEPVATLLLDECQGAVGTRARSKAPALRALLAGSYHLGLGYTSAVEDYNVFCPKAFAGRGQLPEELADRSLPIILEPLKNCVAQPPGSPARAGFSRDGATSAANKKVERFHLRQATEDAEPLQQRLSAWAEQNLPALEKLPPYPEEDFPPNLSPRRQDLCEPLLQLAAMVGGEWPTRARQALTAIFEQEAAFHLQTSLQLLAAVRDCFAHHAFPERLSTAVLLDWMHSLPERPWDVDGRLSAHSLARLLSAFHTHPRLQRIGSANPARGYQLEDFKEPWKKHLGFELPQSEIASKDRPCSAVADVGALSISDCSDGVKGPGRSSLSPVTCDLSPTRGPVASSQQLETHPSEIASKDRPCSTVADVGARSISDCPDGAKNPGRSSLSPVTCDLSPTHGLAASSQQPEAHPSQIASKNRPCNTVAGAHTASVPAPENLDAHPGTSEQILTSNYQLTNLPNYQVPDGFVRQAQEEITNQKSKEKPRIKAAPLSPVPCDPSPMNGFNRLTRLHQELHLQGLCPPLDALAKAYPPQSLNAALDWVDAHPEWSARFRYKPALEFVASFQKTVARIQIGDSR
ncbi:MAG TPA: DUF3631 domain-containing protein [Candidatus Angelobacter sp.]|nr:DUF3631 domain-containing protein [Candidatus Angelobacter sp.]